MIGAGNVATFLAVELQAAGHRTGLVYSRTLANARKLGDRLKCRYTDDEGEIATAAGIKIVALTDEAIVAFAEKNILGQGLLVHTAGSVPMDVFSGCSEDFGVIYPLQTFSPGRNPRKQGVPFCIEASNPGSLNIIRALASAAGNQVYEVSSESRMMLHLAAVIACNFTNHMYVLAEEAVLKAGLPFEILHPLVKETSLKAVERSPALSQTGPAARNDMIIIRKHLDLLSFSPELKELYHMITESIMRRSAHSTREGTGD